MAWQAEPKPADCQIWQSISARDRAGLIAMGQELSCVAVRAKAYEKAESSRVAIEDGLERMADGIEHAANTVEDAIDRATLPPPTLTRCELSELEWQHGQQLFAQLQFSFLGRVSVEGAGPEQSVDH